jgi:GTP-binding protein EngB required for normal cell division
VTANTIGLTGLGHSRLPARLASLTHLTKIAAGRTGSEGFSQELLTDSETLLRRSGERMRMSASHTVVAFAGGTGSGKSSLFNALAGASFSPAGVMRPTTKHLHACVWGMEGAAPLLDWLSVQRRHRYARASALDQGEASLTGLLLLDLPDHDSVVTGSAAMVDRLVKLADMLVWVLDPLKYADASVHRRYLVPLAGHAAVTTVVLNKADTLTSDEVADCAADLRRLLDAEGLMETPVLVTSAATGVGLDELRRTLATVVAAREAASDRISADIDALLERFAVYAGDSVPGWLPPGAFAPPGPGAFAPPGPLGPPGALAPPGASAPQLAAAPTADGTDPASSAPGPAMTRTPERPPWEQDGWVDGTEDPDGPAQASRPPWADGTGSGTGTAPGTGTDTSLDPPNGRTAGTSDWQPWQTTAAPTKPTSTSRPPWEDATRDGRGGGSSALDPVMYIPPGPAAALTTAFAKAAGVAAATETLNGAREHLAASYIGWPPGRLAARLRGAGPTPARKLLAGDSADVVQAQRSDIDNAITVFADEVGGSLPGPWSRTVRAAARSRANEAQAALGAAVAQGLPSRDKVTGWWRLIALVQWLLMLLTLAGVVWIVLILSLHGSHKSSSLISDTSLVPWLAVMVVALLLLGWLIESWCQNMVVLAADREREQANQAIMARIAAVTSDLVLAPAGRELADYERFRAELAFARDGAGDGAADGARDGAPAA